MRHHTRNHCKSGSSHRCAHHNDGMGDFCIHCGHSTIYPSYESGLRLDGRPIRKYSLLSVLSFGDEDAIQTETRVAILDARQLALNVPEDSECPNCEHTFNRTTGKGMTIEGPIIELKPLDQCTCETNQMGSMPCVLHDSTQARHVSAPLGDPDEDEEEEEEPDGERCQECGEWFENLRDGLCKTDWDIGKADYDRDMAKDEPDE